MKSGLLLILWVMGSSMAYVHAQQSSSKRIAALVPGTQCIVDSQTVYAHEFLVLNQMGIWETADSSWSFQPEFNRWCKKNAINDTLWVQYRVFPFRLHDTLSDIHWNPVPLDSNPFPDFRIQPLVQGGGLNRLMGDNSQLRKSGSLTRGVAFGSATDATLLSAFNLQLSGQLSEDIGIEAVITDENIPVQPDGNTTQLQDFDQIYVRLFKDKHQLTAGDFWLNQNSGYFLVLRKRGQGLMASTEIPNRLLGSKWPTGHQSIQLAGAVSRGKFRRQEFQGQEGNLGPYRLSGNEGESFILVLSGSEAVFVDGQKMVRGQDDDYVIDYQTAEVRFTSKRLITKDNRIVVEFEYSDRRYQRWMVQAGHQWEMGNVRSYLQFFSEFDDSNSPLNTTLSDEDKALLAAAGDSSVKALSSTADSLPYASEELRYRKVDSTWNGLTYSVFVVSTNPNDAFWRVRFSYLGPGQGNYEPVATNANGRVFGWKPPAPDGSLQGSYEPVELLVAPKLQQMLVFGAKSLAGPWSWSVEGALSTLDKNRFSTLDANDNHGYAYRLEVRKAFFLTKWGKDSLIWEPMAAMEQVDRDFQPFIRFRSVEFERDWNLVNRNNPNQNLQRQVSGIDYLPETGFRLKHGKQFLSYRFQAYEKGTTFSGRRHQAELRFNQMGFSANWKGSLTQTSDSLLQGNFVRQTWSLKKSWKKWAVGLRGEDEVNPQEQTGKDSLLPSSYGFHEAEAWVGQGDSSLITWRLFYRSRLDRLPNGIGLIEAALAHHAGALAGFRNKKGNRLDLSLTWRELHILDTGVLNLKPSANLLTRLDYHGAWWKKNIRLNVFYETGAGLENRRDYQFIPSFNGLGDFVWIDYDGDGLQARDEFEARVGTVTGSDGLTYLRVWLPTNEYVRAWFNRFTGQLNLSLPRNWNSKENPWWKKGLSRVSAQTVFRTDRKTAQDAPEEVLNPLPPEIQDTNLLSIQYQFRQSVYWNRFGGDFSIEYSWQESLRQSLLSGGRELQGQKGHLGRIRWSFHKFWTAEAEGRLGRRSSRADLLRNREFELEDWSLEPKIWFQPGVRWRAGLGFRWVERTNLAYTSGGFLQEGGEFSRMYQPNLELKWNDPGKGSVEMRVRYIRGEFSGPESSPLQFEMLESLAPGSNITWMLTVLRSLGEHLQLTVQYEGRQSAGNPVVHLASAQLRAFF